MAGPRFRSVFAVGRRLACRLRAVVGSNDADEAAARPENTTTGGISTDRPDDGSQRIEADATTEEDRRHSTVTDGGRSVTDDEQTVTDGGLARERRRETPGIRGLIERRVGEDVVSSAPFWLPPFLLMGLFVYGAVGWNVLISLTDYEGFTGPDYGSLDFEMYRRAFASESVITAGVNTLVLMIGFTVVSLALGLLIAILVDRKIRFENTFRTIYLLPMSLSFVVTAQFWLWMYSADGVINTVLANVGVGPISFVGNQQLVLWAIVFALVWQFSGYTMVVYLAALRAIPTDQFEAARVDGASVVKMYRRVIVPQLKSATVSASVVLMVFSLKAFDFLFAFVGGYRPPNGADILATKMIREAFQQGRWAFGSAIAIVLFLMALAVIGPYLYYEYTHDNL